MINLLKVSDLDFIHDSNTDDILRFIPDNDIAKKYQNRALLKRLFNEDIGIAPQTSEIIQQLINAEPQPATAEQVANFVMAYPYQTHSAIFDYKYLNWSKIGSGQVRYAPSPYCRWFVIGDAAVQYNNIATDINTYGIEIDFTLEVTYMQATTASFLILFNTVNSGTTKNPRYAISFDQNNGIFYLRRKVSTTADEVAVKGSDSEKTYFPPFSADFKFVILPKGAVTLDITSGDHVNHFSISSNTTFNPKNIRLFANTNSTVSYVDNINIKNFKIIYRNSVISQWFNQ